jgi:hypothetical protein
LVELHLVSIGQLALDFVLKCRQETLKGTTATTSLDAIRSLTYVRTSCIELRTPPFVDSHAIKKVDVDAEFRASLLRRARRCRGSCLTLATKAEDDLIHIPEWELFEGDLSGRQMPMKLVSGKCSVLSRKIALFFGYRPPLGQLPYPLFGCEP